MSLYAMLRALIFHLEPERAHYTTLGLLKCATRLGYKQKVHRAPVKLMGLYLDNPIGVAGGLDKNGDYIDALGALGFGFIEVGTVTPKPQAGNPKPRVFRLEKNEAIINRLGFANKGLAYCLDNIKKSKYKGTIGLNMGKNFDTPLENALDDYLICLNAAYAHVDYMTINISSPNTPKLRDLLHPAYFEHLLTQLKVRQSQLAAETGRYVPLCVKLSPDMPLAQLNALIEIMLRVNIDGVIATNTTLSRSQLKPGDSFTQEAGGLSGGPLYTQSIEVVKHLAEGLRRQIPIIASGGMTEAYRIQNALKCGAKAVQVYSGLIYKGPRLIKDALS